MIELVVKKPTVELNASLGGYKEGYDSGYGVGYEEGYNEGYGEGEFEGYKTGEQVGYDEGLQTGLQKGYADGLNEGLQTGYADGYQNGYDEGNSEGLQEAYYEFWDKFQEGGNRRYYRWCFYSQSSNAWTDDTYNPVYPIIAIGDYAGDSMFQSAQITDTKVDIEIGTNASYTFISCYSLKTIRKLIVSENTTFYRWFDGCGALENVTFEGVIANDISFRDSIKLSMASVDSIIEHLKDFTGQSARTLTLHQYVGDKMTPEQKSAIQAKNWTLKLTY